MNAEIFVLGGAEEIGANCTYIDLAGTGILVDAGLHPRDRTARAFPALDAILGSRNADFLVVSHAHNDHLGGVPYVLRRMPYLRTFMTHATRDLSHVMLHNAAKLMMTEIPDHVAHDDLVYYQKETIELLRRSFEALPYGERTTLRGYAGTADVSMALHWAGHILGSAAVELECNGLRILHTADVQFDHQTVVPRARLPHGHVDVLITEATNCRTDTPNDVRAESKRLATFINMVTENNGSVLIPAFALGKTQEIVTLLYSMMRTGMIPYLPIWTGGMGYAINKIYDQFCYSDPMRRPGFEISDVPQSRLRHSTLLTDGYMSAPGIVVASSGMMNTGTVSYRLARAWMTRRNFGIAFIGYQDEASNGYALASSMPDQPFMFGGSHHRRACAVQRFRFSAHASLDGLTGFITDVRPSTLMIVHGEPDACDNLALAVRERLPRTRIIVPRAGVGYLV